MKLFAVLALAVAAQDYYGDYDNYAADNGAAAYDYDAAPAAPADDGNRDGAADAGPGGDAAKSYGGGGGGDPAPLQCWRCNNAYSYAQCENEGYLETCQSNQVFYKYFVKFLTSF